MSVEREFAGGDEHQYKITLEAGQFASFLITKQGADLTLALKDPTGESLLIANFDKSQHGTEPLLLAAKVVGPHTLIVKPAFEKSRPSRYTVRVDELRQASERDRSRFAGQQIFAEADRLFKQETVEARREALKMLSELVPRWLSLEDKVWEARTLHRIGLIHYWLSDSGDGVDHIKQALDFYNQALEIRRAGDDRLGEAETLIEMGDVYSSQNESEKAIERLDQAQLIEQSLNELWYSASISFLLGRIYWRSYESERSIKFYQQAREAFHEAGDGGNEGDVLADLGMMQITAGDFQAALENCRKSLELYRDAKSRYGEVVALHHLGDVYLNLGEPEKAIESYNQALPIAREIRDAYAESYVLIGLGVLHSSIGDPGRALAYLNQSLLISRKLPNPEGEAGALRYLGKVYREIGNFPKAAECLNQALRISEKEKDRHNEAGTLTALGDIYGAIRDYRNAREKLNRALSIRRELGYRRGEAAALFALAVVERDQGNLKESQAYVEEAIKITESLRDRVIGADLRRSYFAAQQGGYELKVDLLMRLHEQSPGAGYDALALQASESRRARELLEYLVEARADIRQGVATALLEEERSAQKQLDAKENERIRLLARKSSPEQKTRIDRELKELLAKLQQAQEQLRAASPRYAALTQPQPLDLKEIQEQLDEDTVLLSYSLGARESYLWAVTPKTVRSYPLPARKLIENAVRQYHSLLKDRPRYLAMGQVEIAAAQLSRILLSPATGELKRKRLVIVADGVLQFLPFSALPAPGGGRPLITKSEIVYLPSVSALSQLRQDQGEREAAPKMMIAIADPVYGFIDPRFRRRSRREPPAPSDGSRAAMTRSARGLGLKAFPRLYYSRREADQIARLIPSESHVKILDFDASRHTLDQIGLSQFRNLHFAAHTLINPKYPELSGIVLSLYDKDRRPLDGFLRAHEIYNLKLNADLVVLSACETALGKEVKGEGLIGLSRGFMYAGAPRLIASLWKVNDEATAELMTRFYREMLQKNLRPAAALRAAQEAMAKVPRWSAPYYWAGFVLQGEWR